MEQQKVMNKFMFYENFLKAIDQLPEDKRYKLCYDFCCYGITGELPADDVSKMLCLAVSASVQKYQGRGGAREGAGAPKGNLNAVKKNNQKQSEQSKQSKQSENININRNINLNINNKTENNDLFAEEKDSRYGELSLVRLTESQYNKLKDKYINLDKAIEKLDTWLGTSGSKNKNKNHFAYFKENSWVWEGIGVMKKQNNEVRAKL